jgi:hypothetical protein
MKEVLVGRWPNTAIKFVYYIFIQTEDAAETKRA